MKKIMFDNHYGLEDAVLNGTKTMTRRIIPLEETKGGVIPVSFWNNKWCCAHGKPLKRQPFKIGEVVAIAQSYHTLNKSGFVAPEWLEHTCESSAGYKNKMFVRADLMPHQIQITDVRVERLQDISDEDCLKEGIMEYYPYIDRNPNDKTKSYRFRDTKSKYGYFQLSPVRDCFAALIRRLSGKSAWSNNTIWEKNPYVFAYSFKLIK